MTQIHSETLFIDGPCGPLEARWDRPDPPPSAGPCAILCHPHPLHGGTLTNKVVHTLAVGLARLGVPALRFNFRGVGASAGTYDEGRGETEDLLAVIDHVRACHPGGEIWLGGFSFGAFVALRASRARPVARLLTVAPPVNLFPCEAPPAVPWLLIQGDADEIVPCDQVLAWAEALPHRPHIACLTGAGHFFHRRLGDLSEALRRHWADAA